MNRMLKIVLLAIAICGAGWGFTGPRAQAQSGPIYVDFPLDAVIVNHCLSANLYIAQHPCRDFGQEVVGRGQTCIDMDLSMENADWHGDLVFFMADRRDDKVAAKKNEFIVWQYVANTDDDEAGKYWDLRRGDQSEFKGCAQIEHFMAYELYGHPRFKVVIHLGIGSVGSNRNAVVIEVWDADPTNPRPSEEGGGDLLSMDPTAAGTTLIQ